MPISKGRCLLTLTHSMVIFWCLLTVTHFMICWPWHVFCGWLWHIYDKLIDAFAVGYRCCGTRRWCCGGWSTAGPVAVTTTRETALGSSPESPTRCTPRSSSKSSSYDYDDDDDQQRRRRRRLWWRLGRLQNNDNNNDDNDDDLFSQ